MRCMIARDGVLVLGALSLLSQCAGGVSNGFRELRLSSRQAAGVDKPAPGHWTAIGDSYSAGPGAGVAYDDAEFGNSKCFRSNGSAVAQLDAQHNVMLGNFQFLSCTGHKAKEMVKYQIPLIDYGEQDSNMWLSLSIGGNDLGFADYAQSCLLGLGSCTKALKNAENLIHDLDGKQTFRRLLWHAWSRIYDDNHFKNVPAGQSKFVPNTLHTLYPAFFNAETDGCDNINIGGPWLFFTKRLTKTLRRQTNRLVRDANNAIRAHARAFVNSEEGMHYRGYLHIVDYDNTFEGHRLCEKFTGNKPGFDNPNVWFLGIRSDGFVQESDLSVQENPVTCNPDADDAVEAWRCVKALVDAAGDDPDAVGEWNWPLWLTKAFHPKTAGFQEVMNLHLSHWVANLPQLRVLALGDSITNGFRSTDNAGYRSRFYELATTSYGQQVDMIGSVRSGDVGDADHEGHNGATIDQISSYADQNLGQRPNVVLLHAGTNDMGSDADAQGAVDRLVALVDKIISKCPDATVLVARITPADDAARQNRTNVYNNGIEAAMSSRADAGAKVQIMYMDLMVTKKTLADGLHPNDIGYFAMAEHWWGGVLQAYNDGWLKDPVDGDGPGPVREIAPSLPISMATEEPTT
ncbi:hypothetical protein PFICI_00291 [Pestalotiopsis fici W106-1]|uniref:SGNH hydrolase-type esterase domain-containing protein n=1 Tax=Pestalotiopsis fici (strain W106-1 / CGMCC3.15140) TaxID=1229662 RepID=W3XK91_PESFW|nr:uncharacterized protein PFICI_00291 [Pestalotiopsis fici W106-1]ETS86463.1 hypothetical protein PFICI_00291 [Pestalotiopsis fici W106-1]